MMRIVVLDGYCINPGDLSWDGLKALGEVSIYDRSQEGETRARAAGATAVLTSKAPISRETLAELSELRYIGVLGTGYDIVDVVAAGERGITVTNIPTYGSASVAQHAIALLLELTNRTALHATASQSGEWSRSPDWSFVSKPLTELSGKTLGIIGFGRIGQQTGRIGHALGMRIVAYDTVMGSGPPDYPFAWVALQNLLEESDAVSLHCPLTSGNKSLINAHALKRMKPTAYLLNTARGPLVDELALAAALNAGELAGAGLDVLSEEPPHAGHPLLSAKNCLVTPHIAWATREARERLLAIAVENLGAWIAGEPRNLAGGPSRTSAVIDRPS